MDGAGPAGPWDGNVCDTLGPCWNWEPAFACSCRRCSQRDELNVGPGRPRYGGEGRCRRRLTRFRGRRRCTASSPGDAPPAAEDGLFPHQLPSPPDLLGRRRAALANAGTNRAGVGRLLPSLANVGRLLPSLANVVKKDPSCCFKVVFAGPSKSQRQALSFPSFSFPSCFIMYVIFASFSKPLLPPRGSAVFFWPESTDGGKQSTGQTPKRPQPSGLIDPDRRRSRRIGGILLDICCWCWRWTAREIPYLESAHHAASRHVGSAREPISPSEPPDGSLATYQQFDLLGHIGSRLLTQRLISHSKAT